MTQSNKSQLEFIILMASLMSLVALSIDAILPGLSQIGKSINHSDSKDLQLIITMIFLGLGVGQLFFGTLSDSIGRKPIIYIGMGIFLVASIICSTAQNLEVLLLGRVLQGIGLSAPRSLSISIIRDLYNGNYMAKVMSFITVIFILVPMIAPLLGQYILDHYNWKAIFYFKIGYAAIIVSWFGKRQRETLTEEKRIKLTKNLFIDGVKEFFKYKESVIYTLVSGLMSGSFMVFLSSSRQIFQDQYGMVDQFAYIFAGMAFFMGVSTFLNGSLVIRFGMKKLSYLALYVFSFNSLLYTILFLNTSNPSIYVLLPFTAIQFLSLGFIFGNVRALTMQPIGHIAGIGSSLSGFISTIMAVPIAMLIGYYMNETALPLFIGFWVCGILAILLFLSLKKK